MTSSVSGLLVSLNPGRAHVPCMIAFSGCSQSACAMVITFLVIKVGLTSSMASIGKFDPEHDTISMFVERLKLFLETNEVAVDKHILNAV